MRVQYVRRVKTRTTVKTLGRQTFSQTFSSGMTFVVTTRVKEEKKEILTANVGRTVFSLVLG